MSSAASINRGSWQFCRRQEYSNSSSGAKESPLSMLVWKGTRIWTTVAAPTSTFPRCLQSQLLLAGQPCPSAGWGCARPAVWSAGPKGCRMECSRGKESSSGSMSLTPGRSLCTAGPAAPSPWCQASPAGNGTGLVAAAALCSSSCWWGALSSPAQPQPDVCQLLCNQVSVAPSPE